MKTFSSLNRTKKETKNKGESLYKNDFVELIDFEGWTFTKEKDMVVCIPYLFDRGKIIIRSEYIPSFKYDSKREHFLSCISGSIEEGETPEEALFRELQEEAGLILKPSYKIHIGDPLYLNKGSNTKIYPSILTLSTLDYDEVVPDGDGTVAEKLSKNILVDYNRVSGLISSDVITSFMLQLLKSNK